MSRTWLNTHSRGARAQTSVKDLLQESGNRVYPYGIESTNQDITQPGNNAVQDGPAIQRLRLMPDFVVVDSKGNCSLVEVKFRALGPSSLLLRTINDIHEKWPETRIVLVRRDKRPFFLFWRSLIEIEAGAEKGWSPLQHMDDWNIDSEDHDWAELLVYAPSDLETLALLNKLQTDEHWRSHLEHLSPFEEL